jgi:hypothetical protein
MLEALGCLPSDIEADFITYQGITDVTGAELAAWAARRKLSENLPGVGLASGRGRHLLVLLPEGVHKP